MKRTGKQIEFCCSGALSWSPVLVKVPVNYDFSTAAVLCAFFLCVLFFVILKRAESVPQAGTHLVQELFISAGRGCCSRYASLQLIFSRHPRFERTECLISIVSFRDLEAVRHAGGGRTSRRRQKVGGCTEQAGFLEETALVTFVAFSTATGIHQRLCGQ